MIRYIVHWLWIRRGSSGLIWESTPMSVWLVQRPVVQQVTPSVCGSIMLQVQGQSSLPSHPLSKLDSRSTAQMTYYSMKKIPHFYFPQIQSSSVQEPVYIKHQRQRRDRSVMMLVILFSLKSRETNENPFWSVIAELCSADADAGSTFHASSYVHTSWFFKIFLEDFCPFWGGGSLIPLFWTSVDVSCWRLKVGVSSLIHIW